MTNKALYGNYFICGNEVFVEGKSIGQFSAFETDETRDNIVASATVTMPFYSIAASAATARGIGVKRVGKNVASYVRVNPDDWDLKTGARIQVYTYYRDNPSLGHVFDRVLAFDGFVREVIGGFPTRILCEDGAFILRFGTVTKSWPNATNLSALIEDMNKTSNEAFAKYRSQNGLSDEFPRLSYNGNSMQGQFVLKPATGVSPYDVLQRVIVGMYKLYGNVELIDGSFSVYAGLGLQQTQLTTVDLDTSVNVIGRDLVPQNMLFENFKVTVRFLENGELKSITKGSKNGVVYDLPFTPGQTAAQMEKTALSVMSGLKCNRNKGTITTLLYPVVKLYDYINYTDTIFTSLSGGYYVIGRRLKCGPEGYRQELTVTNKTFLYLAS